MLIAPASVRVLRTAAVSGFRESTLLNTIGPQVARSQRCLWAFFCFMIIFMNSLKNIVRALQKERSTLSKKIKLIDHGLKALGSLDGLGAGRSANRRRMSAAARRKITRAQKLRWARYRAKAWLS
jgi:hypothetical protein